MKRNNVSLAVLLAALSCFGASSANALPQSQLVSIKQAVANAPVAELAAQAAQLVTQATKADREEVAVVVVREVVSRKPATAAAVVGAVSKVAPELSATVAAEAAKLSESQAPEIARAATTAAPAHAEKIAAAVAKVAPASSLKIARRAVATTPEQASKIVEAIIAAVPSSRASIASDTAITALARVSQSSASETGGSGVISSRPGTISGLPAPNLPPESVGPPVPGEDYARP
jgi:hypothetical protein